MRGKRRRTISRSRRRARLRCTAPPTPRLLAMKPTRVTSPGRVSAMSMQWAPRNALPAVLTATKSREERSRRSRPNRSGCRALMRLRALARESEHIQRPGWGAEGTMADGNGVGRRLRRRDGEALAAAATPGGEHLAATLGLHAGAEPVGLLAVAIAGTIRALHGFDSLV